METAERIMRAQTDAAMREIFIRDNMPFIYSCAAQAAGRFVDESDDVFSEALTAFDAALMSYDENRGAFYAFAKTCITNRIRDYYRVQSKCRAVPFSSLAAENDKGEEKEFDAEDKNAEISDAAIEIYSLKAELELFGISFFELPKAAPKSKKTRKACVEVVHYIAERPELLKSVYDKRVLPTKQVIESLKINKKIMERYRKYLIMGILIVNGGYEILSEYFEPDCRR